MTGGSRILLAALLAAWLASPAFAGDVVVQPTAGDAFVVKDNTGATERLRVDEATGNVSKDGTLFLHSTGTDNACVGDNAGAALTTGVQNAAFGSSALAANQSGINNAGFLDVHEAPASGEANQDNRWKPVRVSSLSSVPPPTYAARMTRNDLQ